MDRQLAHQKHNHEEREYKKDERKQYELPQERQIRTIHPAWFVMLGVVLVVSVVMLWTFI